MKILVLDIGNSNTKCGIYQVSEKCVDTLHFKSVPTPDTALEMLQAGKSLIDDVLHLTDVIIPTSFGDSLMYTDLESEAQIIKPLDMYPNVSVPPYAVTGYPVTKLPGICRLYKTIARKQHKGAILPVSTYFAGWLCGSSLNPWDITHASNSGMWTQKQQQLISVNLTIVHPDHTVGVYRGAKIMIGGHDIAFIDEDCYVHCGTWIIVSKRVHHFFPVPYEEKTVRWLRDAYDQLCRQISFVAPAQIDTATYNKIAGFLGAKRNVTVVGAYAPDMAKGLQTFGFTTKERQYGQYQDTANRAYHGML